MNQWSKVAMIKYLQINGLSSLKTFGYIRSREDMANVKPSTFVGVNEKIDNLKKN